MEKGPQDHSHPLRRPTRRQYVSSRVIPRAGNDIVSARSQKVPSTVKHPKPAHKIPPTQPETNRSHHRTKPAMPRLTRSFVLKREMVEHAKEHRQKVRKNYGKHAVEAVIGLIVLVTLGIIVWSFKDVIPLKLDWWRSKSSSTVHTQSTPVVDLGGVLDETSVTEAILAAHRMGPDEPRIISVPKLDIKTRIMRVGVSLASEPIAPMNIFDVGWFEASGKPGNSSAVLLNGHSRGPTKDGVFASLKILVPGDLILIERGDGIVLTYAVSKIQEYSAGTIDMSAALQTIQSGKQGLNLMTTASKYDTASTQGQKRYIVFALLQ